MLAAISIYFPSPFWPYTFLSTNECMCTVLMNMSAGVKGRCQQYWLMMKPRKFKSIPKT